jgi:dienelactone hydrolase
MAGTDLEYEYGSTRMLGYFCAGGEERDGRPGVLLIHGGFGLGELIKRNAERVAALGYAVFAVDLWGDRRLPRTPAEFVPLIAGLSGDPDGWMGRIHAAHELLVAQPGVDASRIAATGYCFGGSSVLEYARTGGAVRGVVSFHGGLDTVSTDWETSDDAPKVLICTGANDRMAAPPMVADLQTAMTAAAVDWETDVYSGTGHAFTFSDSHDYNPQSDRRSWNAMRLFLEEVFV